MYYTVSLSFQLKKNLLADPRPMTMETGHAYKDWAHGADKYIKNILHKASHKHAPYFEIHIQHIKRLRLHEMKKNSFFYISWYVWANWSCWSEFCFC